MTRQKQICRTLLNPENKYSVCGYHLDPLYRRSDGKFKRVFRSTDRKTYYDTTVYEYAFHCLKHGTVWREK